MLFPSEKQGLVTPQREKMMYYENMLADCTANQLGFYLVILQAIVKKRLYKLFTHKGNDKTGSNNSETKQSGLDSV